MLSCYHILRISKNVENNLPRGGEIMSSTLDNVQYKNEIIKIYRIIKYIYKIILLQNLLVNYTKYN